MVGAINNEEFFTDLDDKSLYQFRFMTTGGYVVSDATDSVNAAITQLVNIANLRGDCLAIVDHDRDLITKDDIITAAQKSSDKRAAMFSP